MNVSAEQLEQEKQEFLILKQKIVEELGFYGLNDDEIEDALKKLLAIESETFDNSMNDLVLKKYYEYFLYHIYPQIKAMLNININGNNELSTNLLLIKNEINRKNKLAIDNSINSYFYQMNDDYLVNQFNSHEVLLSEEIKNILSISDIFLLKKHYDEKIATKYPTIEFNYNPVYWQLYAEHIEKNLCFLNEQLEDKIPNFPSCLELYEQHIRLYKAYIAKYRFISANEDFNIKKG